MINKKEYGQFFTKKDLWLKPQVVDFIKKSGATVCVDPYAGQGDLLGAMTDLGYTDLIGYDIDPSMRWHINDSLVGIPYHENAIIITNPPYLGKSSAARMGMGTVKYFKDNDYVDLYQLALEKVLDTYEHAVFIIPETYLLSKFFKKDLYNLTVIEESLFDDTDCPVCVCCFKRNDSFMSIEHNIYDIYKGDNYIFSSDTLEYVLDKFKSCITINIVFNDKQGNLGLRGIDGVKPNDRIRFCFPHELDYNLDKIKVSSRAITVINVKEVDITQEFIDEANEILEQFRRKTHDVLLAPFKNNNKLGKRRRRLDFYWARKILEKNLEKF